MAYSLQTQAFYIQPVSTSDFNAAVLVSVYMSWLEVEGSPRTFKSAFMHLAAI